MARKFAADDANLSTGSIIVSRTKEYSDIQLSFQPVPGSGDIYVSKDAAAVKQAVKNLIMTNPGEVPFAPNQGAGIRSFLFELNDSFTAYEIEQAVRNTIKNYEPRARVRKVEAAMRRDGNTANITIEFQVVSTNETVVLRATVERLR